jgi:hypothetical protein
LIKDVLDSSEIFQKQPADESTEILLRIGEEPSFWGMRQSPWTCWLIVMLGAQEVGQIRIFNDKQPDVTAATVPDVPVIV